MWWLVAACASVLACLTVALGTLVPLQRPDGVEYLFIQPHIGPLAVTAGLAAVVIVTLYLAVRVLARSRPDSERAVARSGRWLAPLCAMGTIACGLLPAVPHVGEHGAVVGYFFYDLRWWWLALLSGTALARADHILGGAVSSRVRAVGAWTPTARRRTAATVIFAGAVTVAIVTTPHLRFSGMLHGDEPRYIRYCELWYEGGGLDVSRVALVGDTPTLTPHVLGNAKHLFEAIRSDSGALVRDLAEAGHHPFTFKWNRATAEDAFVHGIHGGLYQVHQPGVSVILFPGYFVDRYLLSHGAAPDGKFPDALPMTNVMMLLTYGLAGVALFRLLASALQSDAWAAAFAAIGILTLPGAAFPFQFYPELPVLVIVLTVARYLWFSSSTRAGAATIAGAAAGSMAWFHPRFLLLGLGFIAVALVRRSGRARVAFLSGFAALLFSLMAYDYHVTGSWLPTALWDATGEGVSFADSSVIGNFIGYAIDRTWGLAPHALILIGAVPGLIVLGRQSLGHAMFVGGMTAALTLTAAGHTLSAAGTTPDRLVVAAVPLLIWPLAELARRCWHSPATRAAVTIATIMSLDAAFSYNLHHEKPVGPMHDASVVGWKPNLAFPIMRGDVWSSSSANFLLFFGVAAAILLVTLVAWRIATRRPETRVADIPAGLTAPLIVVGVLVFFTVATSANGDWTSRAYLLDRDAARVSAAQALVDADRCRLCMSSTSATVHWSTLEPNSAHGAALSVERDRRQVRAHVHVDGDGESPAFGRVRIEFGDGTATPWTGVVTDRTLDHTYAGDGMFLVTMYFQLPTGETKISRQTVDVRAGDP